MKTRFLNGDREEKLYIKQPEGFTNDKGNQVFCKLRKTIYELKHASHQCYLKFHNFVVLYIFTKNIIDQYIYVKASGSKYIFSVLYVDDILLTSSDLGLLHETK